MSSRISIPEIANRLTLGLIVVYTDAGAGIIPTIRLGCTTLWMLSLLTNDKCAISAESAVSLRYPVLSRFLTRAGRETFFSVDD